MSAFHRGAIAMLAEKATKMASQLVILILLARYLGAEDMGQLIYCFALASIFVFLNGLGLDTLLVKRFVDQPQKRSSYLKHALLARLAAAVICVVLVNIVGIWLVDDTSRMLLLIISLYHLFMPFMVFESFYQAQGRGDLSALGLIAGHLSGFLFRLLCLYMGGELIWLAFAYVFEMLVMAMAFVVITKKQSLPAAGPVSADRAITLIKDASPLIISGAVVLLYMKVDQLMLGLMKGNAEVGIYVAATRLSEAWYFVGLTLIGVYFPKLLQTLRCEGTLSYHTEIIAMARKLVWCAFGLSLVTVCISDWLVVFLYGSEFSRAAEVLMITIWSVPFVYLGGISTKMYVADSRQGIVLWRSIFGLVMNVFLNFFLIEKYGASGAALASLAAQIGACYLFNCVVKLSGVFAVQTKIILFFRR